MFKLGYFVWSLSKLGQINYGPTETQDATSPALSFFEDKSTIEGEIRSALVQGRSLILGYFLRLLLLVFFYAVMFVFFRLMILLSDRYYYDPNTEIFLDRIHNMIDDKNLPFLKMLAEYTFYPFVGFFLLRFLLFYPPVFNLQVWVRFTFLYVVALFLRGLSVIYTTIPSPCRDCTPMEVGDSILMTIKNVIIFGHNKVSCSGLLFSPHAYILSLTFIIVAQNSDHILSILMFVYAGIVNFSIITTKVHYSIDVMFSIIFSVFFYYLYYTSIDAYGVYVLNDMNNLYANPSQLKTTILEESSTIIVLSWFENIKKLVTLGAKVKKLQRSLEHIKEVDEKLLKKFNSMVKLFGLADCDDVLVLYRGTEAFNFSYFQRKRRNNRN